MSDKGTRSSHITLIDKNNIISKENDVAEVLNNFFDNAVKQLNINENRYLLSDTYGIEDPVDIAVEKFRLHPSIVAIKENVLSSDFCFKNVTLKDIEN